MLSKQNRLNIVKFPVVRRPLGVSSRLNFASLNKFIEREQIEVVINGSSQLFGISGKRDYKYICDLADVPVSDTKGYYARFVQHQLELGLREADFVTVSSRGLVSYLSKYYGKNSIFIPNGADIVSLRSPELSEIEKIRQRYGLGGYRVIGYIGNLGPWVNLELVIDAFRELQNELKNIRLLFVGSVTEADQKRFQAEDIIFTGGVDAEKIEPYFSLIDVGIIPSKASLFQDLAFHIKAIEYTAARKPVISTPLGEMKLLNFPNVIFAREEKQEWVKAMKQALNMPWQAKWDALIEEYDWKNISGRFTKLFLSA